LGFYSVNRPEWVIGELGGHRQRLATVALYDTLGPETIEFVLNHAEVPVLLLSADKILNILQMREKLPLLKGLISMDSLDTFSDMIPPAMLAGIPFPGTMPVPGHVLRAWAAEKGLKLIDFAELEAMGRDSPMAPRTPTSDDIATFCYTSGTTGNPKGAILTHLNIISAVAGVQSSLGPQSDDIHISYLPLAHIYERVSLTSMLHVGVGVGFSRGDTALLMDDIAVLQPTLFITVPRLLNRVYDKLTAATINADGLVGVMARRAVASKLNRLSRGLGYTHPVWDRLLFNKVRQVMGGRVRLILTGSAPIGNDVLQFLRIAFCCQIHEGNLINYIQRYQ
jgi:long-chain acyl-CoA synthetase